MKRDINLLPVKKGDPKKRQGIIVAVVVTFVYVVVFGLGILIPKGIKDASELLEAQMDNQITQLQPQVDEYNALTAQLAELRESMETTGAIYFNEYNAIKALDIIQQTCPTGVTLQTISNSEMTMTLDCIASDNYQIAQFALELERSGHFQTVYISGSQPTLLIMDENQQETGANAVSSSILLVYNFDNMDDLGANDAGEGA